MRMSLEDLKAKIEWEGGLYATLIYGVKHTEVPSELAQEWKEAQDAATAIENLEDRLEHGYD